MQIGFDPYYGVVIDFNASDFDPNLIAALVLGRPPVSAAGENPGQNDDFPDVPAETREAALEARGAAPAWFNDWVDQHSMWNYDTDMGWTVRAVVVPTPGLYNDGHGHISDTPGPHAAYCSVMLPFNARVPAAVLDVIRTRAAAPALIAALTDNGASEDLTVTGIRHCEISTEFRPALPTF